MQQHLSLNYKLPSLHFEGPTRDALERRGRGQLVALFLASFPRQRSGPLLLSISGENFCNSELRSRRSHRQGQCS